MDNTRYNFTAIDFENAHYARYTPCAIGLVRIEKGIEVARLYQLLQPPCNEYVPRLSAIHGIKPAMTADKPNFQEFYPEIQKFIDGQNVVAHNGTSFDFHVIDKSCAFHNMELPIYNRFDTYKIYGKKLNLLCNEFNIKLSHHNALSDAVACSLLYLRHLMVEDGFKSYAEMFTTINHGIEKID